MASGIQGPFGPLSLTHDQRQHCKDLAFQLLDRTLRSYDERDDSRDPHTGSPRHHRDLDSAHWKQLRTRANASLYSERKLHSALPGDHPDNSCVLLAVGRINSSLDEVMFGLETPDFLALKVRSAVLSKQSLDGATLAQLAGPTETDPFQFMGITWMVGKQSWPLSALVRSRDFVIVSATGVVNRANGERFGYEVSQSIDLPQCPPLPAPMVRGKLMYGAIYRQLENGAVDVYILMHLRSQGRISNKLVVATMWDSTLGFWKAPRLSEMKKLQWCIENKSDKRREQASAAARSDRSTYCDVCAKQRSQGARRHSAHSNNDQTACSLCATSVCAICRVKRTIKIPCETSGKLVNLCVSLCRACMQFVQQQCPATIAKLNAKQRLEGDERSSNRLTLESVWGNAVFSPTASGRRYPSISVSDLVKLINRFADVDTPKASHTMRRKTDPVKL